MQQKLITVNVNKFIGKNCTLLGLQHHLHFQCELNNKYTRKHGAYYETLKRYKNHYFR